MRNYTILLIDYEPRSIEQMRRLLTGAGFDLEVASDGLSGLEAFARLQPDLVIIEAMIPKKHGFEVCQEIKRSVPGKRTPVIVQTAVYKGRKYRSQALHIYGCDEYLEKPFSEEFLLQTVKRRLGLPDDFTGTAKVVAGAGVADTLPPFADPEEPEIEFLDPDAPSEGTGDRDPGDFPSSAEHERDSRTSEPVPVGEDDHPASEEISRRLDAVFSGLGEPGPVAKASPVVSGRSRRGSRALAVATSLEEPTEAVAEAPPTIAGELISFEEHRQKRGKGSCEELAPSEPPASTLSGPSPSTGTRLVPLWTWAIVAAVLAVAGYWIFVHRL